MRDGMPSESNRYDGAPAPDLTPTDMGAAPPSREEAEAGHKRYLAEQGCKKCDCDDPEELQQRAILMPSCSALQRPRDPYIILCDECYENRETLRERALRQAREKQKYDSWDNALVDGVAFYECGNWTNAERPTTDDGQGNSVVRPHAEASAPVRCRCGKPLDEYVPLSEGEDGA